MILAMVQFSGKKRVSRKNVKCVITEEAVPKKYPGLWSCPTELITLREKIALLISVVLGM